MVLFRGVTTYFSASTLVPNLAASMINRRRRSDGLLRRRMRLPMVMPPRRVVISKRSSRASQHLKCVRDRRCEMATHAIYEGILLVIVALAMCISRNKLEGESSSLHDETAKIEPVETSARGLKRHILGGIGERRAFARIGSTI